MKPGPKPLMPRAFYLACWEKRHVRLGFCRSCHRRRDRADRVNCQRCRRMNRERAARRYTLTASAVSESEK